MFKVSLENELKKKVETKKKEQDPINEIKLLLESCESEDRRIMTGLSERSEVARFDSIRGSQIELENLESEYHGKIYTKSEIRDLAIDYKLRFLSSKYYTGKFDTQVSAKIKEFSKETKTQIDNHTLGTKFFILAPEENFELKDEKYITKKQLDPVIFYKIDNEHYRLIHKWGNDFTIFRLIKGFSYRNWWNHQLVNSLSISPIVAFLLSFAVEMFGGKERSVYDGFSILGYTITVSLFSFLFAYLFWGFSKHDEGDQIDGFFTPHNWDNDKRIKN